MAEISKMFNNHKYQGLVITLFSGWTNKYISISRNKDYQWNYRKKIWYAHKGNKGGWDSSVGAVVVKIIVHSAPIHIKLINITN